MSRAGLAALLVAGLSLLPAPVTATGLAVAPLFADLEAVPGATTSLTVTNELDRPAAVQITVRRRRFDQQGRELAPVPAKDAFLVFPPQALIAPGASQVFRLRYLAPPAEQTVAYRVVVEQLPLDLGTSEPSDSSLRLLVSVLTNLYVSPPDSRARVSVAQAEPLPSGEGIRLVVRNTGARYARLQQGRLTVVCLGEGGVPQRRRVLVGAEVSLAIGSSYVPPHGRRTFQVPFADAHQCAAVRVRIESWGD